MDRVLATFEHIVVEDPLTWKLTALTVPAFESMWHFHPEFELTYIRSGHGTRLVGDSVEDYGPGDLTLIGPDLPHTYVSTPGHTGHAAVVVQFRRDFLGSGFFDAPMFAAVSRMLDDGRRGLRFSVQDGVFDRLETLPPAEKTVELLALLVALAAQPAHALASERGLPALNRASARQVEAMVSAIHDGYTSALRLADIAAAAHLAPGSASRLFSRSTGSTISTYLTVVRVNAACQLLRDTDQSIATVAAAAGFDNLSNFNRRFRQVKRVTPRQFRQGFAVRTAG